MCVWVCGRSAHSLGVCNELDRSHMQGRRITIADPKMYQIHALSIYLLWNFDDEFMRPRREDAQFQKTLQVEQIDYQYW